MSLSRVFGNIAGLQGFAVDVAPPSPDKDPWNRDHAHADKMTGNLDKEHWGCPGWLVLSEANVEKFRADC